MNSILEPRAPLLPGWRVGSKPDGVSVQAPTKRRTVTPRGLWAASLVVTGVLLLPLFFLLSDAQQAGWEHVFALLLRPLTLDLLVNTVSLAVLVTGCCAVIGTAAAVAVERTSVPFLPIWSVLLVLPIAVPDFLLAYGWVSVAPWVSGFFGAALVMTAGLYPLVYLPVSASLRGADPGQEEVARSLGFGPWQTLWRITLRQALPGILGGCLLVSLPLLAEYGAFEMLRFRTFTTTIVTEFQVGFDATGACALSLVLVGLGLCLLAGEGWFIQKTRRVRAGVRGRRAVTRYRLGVGAVPVMTGLVAVVALGLGMPVGVTLYWLVRGGASTLPTSASVGQATLTTVLYSASAGAIATVAAVPLALLAVNDRRLATMLLERLTFVILSVPGLVVALSFIFFSTRYATELYQTSYLLVAAYAILFFPFALVAVRASVTRMPAGLDLVARSLGASPLVALLRVTAPLILPGLVAAFCLVFLLTATEITTTLLLIPAGTQTLSTQFWAFSQELSYGAAAPYALAMLMIAIVPACFLGMWFNRETTAGRAA